MSRVTRLEQDHQRIRGDRQKPPFLLGRPGLAGACLTALALALAPSSGRAETARTAATYDPNSPHWSHINVADLGRRLRQLPAGPIQQAAYDWYARHIDLMEVGMDTFRSTYSETQSATMKALNPTFKTWGYDYDLTMDQSVRGFGALPEDQYLHFSEDTRLKFIAPDGSVADTLDIPGCPEPGTASPACRVRTYLYDFARWLPNFKNLQWRQWYADHLLDEMAHDRNGRPNPIDIILSGGGIREYGGLVPRDYHVPGYDELDMQYNADVVNWLRYLRTRFAAAGKAILPNTAEYFSGALGFNQSFAAKGAYTELLQAPISFTGGAPHYQRFIDQVHQITSGGGTLVLAYTSCYSEPPGFGAGNYPTALDRFKMWMLASYYMVRELPAEAGRAYFDANLCINLGSSDPLDFRNGWLAAYEADVGSPLDSASVYQHGPQGCTGYEYIVFARHYTNALVLVRPRGDYNCTDYSDATAIDVPLPSAMVMLEPDGTTSAPMTSIALRNGDAAILFSGPDVTPPSPVNDLRRE
jgi:hypothetical protein